MQRYTWHHMFFFICSSSLPISDDGFSKTKDGPFLLGPPTRGMEIPTDLCSPPCWRTSAAQLSTCRFSGITGRNRHEETVGGVHPCSICRLWAQPPTTSIRNG